MLFVGDSRRDQEYLLRCGQHLECKALSLEDFRALLYQDRHYLGWLGPRHGSLVHRTIDFDIFPVFFWYGGH